MIVWYGPVGWSVFEDYGGEENTTAPAMEITAAIKALERLVMPCHVRLFTDHQAIVKAMAGRHAWIRKWRSNDWVTAKGHDVVHRGLWTRLDKARRNHVVEFEWVRGHDGDIGNERADELARMGRSLVEPE